MSGKRLVEQQDTGFAEGTACSKVYLGELYGYKSRALQVVRLRPDHEMPYILKCLEEEALCVLKSGVL